MVFISPFLSHILFMFIKFFLYNSINFVTILINKKLIENTFPYSI